ncbi:MAG: flagellin, partial [bacterium]|nr:flagellin [bacterium]
NALGTVYQGDGVGAVLTGRAGNAAEGLSIYSVVAAGAGAGGDVTVTNNSLNFQVGANAGQSVTLAIDSTASTEIGTGLDATQGGTNQFASLSSINIETAAKASDAIKIIDQAISDISSLRGTLGAFQANTLESGMNNMRVSQENLVAAESIVRDTDMAAEMASFTRNQIMLQASTAMLSHANSSPQVVLQLIG